MVHYIDPHHRRVLPSPGAAQPKDTPKQSPAAAGSGPSETASAPGTNFADLRIAMQNSHLPPAAQSAGNPVGDEPPRSAGEEVRLRWAAEQLEALFLQELWKSMRSTVPKGGMFDNMAVDLFEEMLDEERSKTMAAAGGIGLAQMIYEQMSAHLAPRDDEEN